jgi:hypothetical protein
VVEDGQFRGLASLERDLNDFVEADVVVDCRISQNLGQSLLRIFCHIFGILVGATYFDAVIGSVSKSKVCCLGSGIKLVLK